MSRENLLNSIEEERTEAEALAQQERDAVGPITQPPYVVLSEEMNPISFHSGLSGSLTKLSNGDDYLVAGTSDISLSTGSNGAITIDMDDVVYDNWKVGPTTIASGTFSIETILRDETNRGGLEIYRASDAAKSKFMSIRNYALGAQGVPLQVISDEEGGLFVAVNASTNTSSQNARVGNLIHVDSSGSVSNFDVAVNGPVYSLLLSGSGADKTLFVGGNFNKVGHSAPAGFAVDLSTGEVSDPFDVSTSHAIGDMVVLSDGSIIIGGAFTRVKGITRNGLAKINPDGTLSTWNPGVGPSHFVYSLVADEANDILYVGGIFARAGDGYGSTTRSNLAAIKISDGTVTPWNPSATFGGSQSSATIRKMILDSSANILYVGGYFNTLGNGGSATAVSSMGAISTVDGSRIDWSPNLSAASTVYDMVLDAANSVIYAGGTFTSANLITRNRLAAWSTTGTGLLTPTSWNPGTSGFVYALAHDSANNKMYVGGGFTGLGGGTGVTTRNRIGAVSTSDDGTVDSLWDPSANGNVYGIALSDNNVYVAGSFSAIGFSTQIGLAKLSKADGVDNGAKLTWDYQPSTSCKAYIYSNKLYAINAYNGQGFIIPYGLYFADRNRLFAIDPNYRRNSNSIANKDTFLKAWNPGCNGSVLSLEKDPVNPTIYIGGSFGRMGANSDIPRQNISSVDSRGTGQVSDWSPYVSSTCYDLKYDSSEQKVYVAGAFSRAGDSPTVRAYLARFPVTSTSPATISVQGGIDIPGLATISTPWPSSTGRISYGAVENGESGTSYRVINVSAAEGSTVSMTFDVSILSSFDYLTIKNLETGVYITQNTTWSGRVRFSSLSPGNYGVGINSTAGASSVYGWRLEGVTYNAPADSWYPNLDDFVYSIDLDSTDVYAAGRFGTVGGLTRRRVAAISKSTGVATSWNPDLNMVATAIKKSGNSVYVGGDFTGLATSTSTGLLYDTVASPTNADGYVADLNVNGDVFASVALADGSFIIGGNFTAAGGGTPRSGLAKFSAAGVLDSTWNPNVYAVSGMAVRAIEYNSATGLIYVGGTFSRIGGSGGTIRSNLAAISATGVGTVDATWNPGCAGDVHALNLDTSNSRLYVGGAFSGLLGGATRNRLGAVSSTGTGTVVDWNPSITNGTVQALARSSSRLYVGGTWSGTNAFAGITKNYLGAVSTSATGTVIGDSGFTPSPNGNVTGLAFDSSYATLYCAGRFTFIGGLTRYMVAVLNTTGAAWSWNGGNNSYANSSVDRKVLLYTTRDKVYFSKSIYSHGSTTSSDGSPVSSLACFSRPTNSSANSSIVDWNPGIYGTINSMSMNSSGVLFVGLTNSAANWKTIYPTDRVVKLSALTSTAPAVLEWGTVTSRQRDSVRGLYVGNVFGGEYVIATSDDAKSSAAALAMFYSTSITTQKPRYVVENDLLKMSYQLNVTSTQTLAGNGNYIITLPQGWYIDTEKVTLGTVEGYYSDFSNATIVGIGSIRGNVVGGGGAWALIPINRTQMVLVGKSPASNQVVVWGANAFPWTTTGGLKVHLTTCIPVKSNNLY